MCFDILLVSVIFTTSLNSADCGVFTRRVFYSKIIVKSRLHKPFLDKKNDENKCMGLLHVFTSVITTMTNVHLTLH